MSAKLALFDLDNTLLAGDSDHAWGEFLIARDMVDAQQHRQQNDFFYQQYSNGKLDIDAYVNFTIEPVRHLNELELKTLHTDFMQQYIQPMVLDKALQLVERHRQRGELCLIITATNEFITAPIIEIFKVEQLLATRLESINGFYTGKIAGIPCLQQGKVDRLMTWLESQKGKYSLQGACFYSDSINDLPLLELVDKPVAVDPDPKLREIASAKNWEIISLRD